MRRLFILLFLGFSIFVSQAQTDLSIVYVTSQDNLVLRLGPGLSWDRLVTIPHSTTLLATGRSVRSDWIQVAYEGVLDEGASPDASIDGVTYGWLSADFLIWTGDVLSLPVDGIPTVAYGRMSAPQTRLYAGRLYYREIGDFANPIEHQGETAIVELTGRVGSMDNGYFWLQFRYNGAYFWYPTWAADPPRGYRALLDGSYLYSFGGTYLALRMLLNDTQATMSDIASRWDDLANGFATTCNNVPAQILIPEGIYRDDSPLFAMPRLSLLAAVTQINLASAKLEEVCARPIESRFASSDDVEIATAAIADARVELDLLRLLLPPLASRDPVANNTLVGD